MTQDWVLGWKSGSGALPRWQYHNLASSRDCMEKLMLPGCSYFLMQPVLLLQPRLSNGHRCSGMIGIPNRIGFRLVFKMSPCYKLGLPASRWSLASFQHHNCTPNDRDQLPWRKWQLWSVDSLASYPWWASSPLQTLHSSLSSLPTNLHDLPSLELETPFATSDSIFQIDWPTTPVAKMQCWDGSRSHILQNTSSPSTGVAFQTPFSLASLNFLLPPPFNSFPPP